MLISFFKNRFDTQAKIKNLSFKEFVEMLRTPRIDDISYNTYIKLEKEKQMNYKDCGGFVGGVFEENKRSGKNLKERSLLTIDVDHLYKDLIGGEKDRIINLFKDLKINTLIHSTRNHKEDAPRLRIIIELDVSVDTLTYEKLAQNIIDKIGSHFVDLTCKEAGRLMFLPSICKDSEYIFEYIEGKPLSLNSIKNEDAKVKEVLANGENKGGLEATSIRRLKADPREKKGLIGAICKAYRVDEIIDNFLGDIYEKGKFRNRYRLKSSNSIDGVVIYDDGLFMYSNHESDKARGKELNAYDLLKLYYCEGLDEKKSYLKILKMFEGDEKVTKYLKEESNLKLVTAFSEKTELDVDKRGKIKNTLGNYVLILNSDETLKDTLAYDSFKGKTVKSSRLPWVNNVGLNSFSDFEDYDENMLLLFIEQKYGVKQNDHLQRAINIVARRNSFNAVASFLNSLKWDGIKRIDTLLYDYLGASKDIYTAAVMRKALTAAVARALNENVKAPKYDYMIILSGPQGCGKSTFLSILGGDYFSDSLSSFVGKEASEQLKGVWFVEVAELAAMGKYTTEQIKNFITKVNDIYRESYARNTAAFQRRCIFFGTTNRDEFLIDDTGNRRFLPVKVGLHKTKKDIWQDLENEREQIFAEAVHLYKTGESLKLNEVEEAVAVKKREESEEKSLKLGLIEEYLERELPANWNKLSIFERRAWLEDRENKGSVKRKKVCIAEIWCECFSKDITNIKRSDRLEIANSLRQIGGWEIMENPCVRPGYGKQKGYNRTEKGANKT